MQDLSNWRPISLLCVDYKILAKVLSIRLKNILPEIIEDDQTCGIINRSIFQNLLQVRDIIYNCNAEHLSSSQTAAYIISVDFEKAFDKVDRSFLKKVLIAFGFGPRYVNFIISSNENSFARVNNGGYHTDLIALRRGLKQGDQQSQQLYGIIAEVLAISIRKNSNILGFDLPDGETAILSLYADDNNSIHKTKDSVSFLFAELEKFRLASSCNINLGKTQSLALGSAEVPPKSFHNIEWNPPDGVKILGITFFKD